MEKVIIKVVNESPYDLPSHASMFASGVDLIAASVKRIYKGEKQVDVSRLATSIERGYIKLRGFERALIGTGLFVEIPDGYEWQIRSRSGLALKQGLFVGNQPGTIDSDYRGEIGVILFNSTPFLNTIKLGERIAQAVLVKVSQVQWELSNELLDSQRSSGGFGSTGS